MDKKQRYIEDGKELDEYREYMIPGGGIIDFDCISSCETGYYYDAEIEMYESSDFDETFEQPLMSVKRSILIKRPL